MAPPRNSSFKKLPTVTEFAQGDCQGNSVYRHTNVFVGGKWLLFSVTADIFFHTLYSLPSCTSAKSSQLVRQHLFFCVLRSPCRKSFSGPLWNLATAWTVMNQVYLSSLSCRLQGCCSLTMQTIFLKNSLIDSLSVHSSRLFYRSSLFPNVPSVMCWAAHSAEENICENVTFKDNIDLYIVTSLRYTVTVMIWGILTTCLEKQSLWRISTDIMLLLWEMVGTGFNRKTKNCLPSFFYTNQMKFGQVSGQRIPLLQKWRLPVAWIFTNSSQNIYIMSGEVDLAGWPDSSFPHPCAQVGGAGLPTCQLHVTMAPSDPPLPVRFEIKYWGHWEIWCQM